MNTYLTTLRNKNTATAEFRRASDLLAHALCFETLAKLEVAPVTIETPLCTTAGATVPEDVMVLPILRSGLALLPAFTEALPALPVGILGLERDEHANVRTYYQKLPTKLPTRVVILDPMLATGASAVLAVEYLVQAGYAAHNIFFTGVLASAYGFACLKAVIPESNITLADIDPILNDKKYIVPGLGDYGDRYFGTLH